MTWPHTGHRPSAGECPGHPRGGDLCQQAVPTALWLIRGIRDEGPPLVWQAVAHLDGDELVALLVVLAALAPADVDPAAALAWCDLPPAEWPAGVVASEEERWVRGDRDITARLGAAEAERRRGSDGGVR